jgi:ribosomal protein L11 methyltransferase
MDLWETRAEIAPADADAVDTLLQESGGAGWTLLEDAIAKRAWIVGIFASKAEADEQWRHLDPGLPGRPASGPVTRRLPDQDWKESYKAHFKAWTFGRLHWVPVWERETFILPDGHTVLWLDPGLAFGTGNHETTRLCIERMVEFERARGGTSKLSMVDAGCGSGILALSAALLGFARVSGFDNDAEAIRVSLENADLNLLSSRVRFEAAGLPEAIRGTKADFVAANIQSDVLIRNAGALSAAVGRGGALAMSGILATEITAVRDAFTPHTGGWASDSRVMGEWCDLFLERP